jgi:hypothetical protein
MDRAYIETTIPSLLAANPSRDVITAARQLVTADWWAVAPPRLELVISETVLAEIRAGDPVMAARRVELSRHLPVLELSAEVRELARYYQSSLGLPAKAHIDGLHIAYAVQYEIEYLVTWNCAHIANEQVIRRLHKLNERLERPTPLIVTPDFFGTSEPRTQP